MIVPRAFSPAPHFGKPRRLDDKIRQNLGTLWLQHTLLLRGDNTAKCAFPLNLRDLPRDSRAARQTW
jgi:hypothetical protein